MKKIKFILALHNHQPVGNFEHISEEAYQKAYLPMVEVLKEHPWFSACLHYTGPLLEWLVKEHPEFIRMVREMVEAGQVEVMGGGFYEPILALLPDEDKQGQIRKLSAFVKEQFGREPSGMWLAERVWEPHLAHDISVSGIDYVVVDDYHFKMSGFRDRELTGYFLTEEHGSILKVFPGSEKLRYTMPFKEPEDTIEYLKSLPDAGEHTLAVMADDGEKFGTWPGTFKWVYEDGWLKRFIKAIEKEKDWLSTTTFSEYIKEEKPRGRAYLPTCSYAEMGEWSLPPKAMLEYEDFLEQLKLDPQAATKRLFIKGGFFRNFLSKYPESNAMHKRMLMVSAKVQKAIALSGGKAGKKKRAPEHDGMLEHLWAGQCNDAYWHGVFGGLYLPHLRDALYRHLIKADEAADSIIADAEGKNEYLLVEEADLDGDLAREVMVSNRLCALLMDPAEGGTMYEFDYRPVSMNFMNTLARREEAYHKKIAEAVGAGETGGGATTIHERVAAKEEGLSEHLQYDWYRRSSLIDHFLDGDADFESFRRAGYHEAGDFVQGEYALKTRKKGDSVKLSFTRTGSVTGQPVKVEKVVTVAAGEAGFEAAYTLTNEGPDELNATFGTEFNLSLLAADSPDRYFEIKGHVLKSRNFASSGELNNVSVVRMVDEWLGYSLSLDFSEVAVLWRFPVDTVSQSEAGFERVYQGSSVMPLWRISLKPGGKWNVGIKFALDRRS